MSYTRDELNKFSGEENYRQPLTLNYPIIQLNGDVGEFHKLVKSEETGKYEKQKFSDSIEGVIIRVRRTLNSWNDGFFTNEHDSPRSTITLWEKRDSKTRALTVDSGIAKEVKERFKTLKTTQILYTVVNGEVFKIMVKGSSLGSESKPEGALGFYDYLQEFKSNEHLHEFRTKFTPVQEKKGGRTYFSISFSRGEKLSDEELSGIGIEMKKIHDVLSGIRENNLEKKITEPEKEELPVIEVDENEIKSEDLPF